MATLLRITSVLVLLGFFFALLHRCCPADAKQRFFRRGFYVDVVWWYFGSTIGNVFKSIVLAVPFVLMGLVIGLSPEALKRGEYEGFGPLLQLPQWFQILFFLVLFDFILYWIHRLFHTGWWWHFHAVHHSSEELDWLSAVRVHPVSEVISNLISIIPMMALGFNPKLVIPFVPIVGFYAVLVHANVNWSYGPLRLVIASPVFHRWHHSRDRNAIDKNFGALFPIWDLLFGTLYLPRHLLPQNFGVHERMSEKFWQQLLFPFRQVRNRHPQS